VEKIQTIGGKIVYFYLPRQNKIVPAQYLGIDESKSILEMLVSPHRQASSYVLEGQFYA